MGAARITTTVTLDGRALIMQGRNSIELLDAAHTHRLLRLLLAALGKQLEIGHDYLPFAEPPTGEDADL